jgi:hypothetical protein
MARPRERYRAGSWPYTVRRPAMSALHTQLREALSKPKGGAAIAFALAAFLHLPGFRYDLISDDEAIYDAMAQVVSRGGVMYRDTVDHKPPGLVYSYAAVRWGVEHLGGGFPSVLAGVHLLGLLVAGATAAALYAVGRSVLEARLAWIPPLLYALVSASNQPPDSLAVNGELLMNLPTVLAVWCALVASRAGPGEHARRSLGWVAAGAMCGVAALYKYQAALVGASFFFLVPPDETRDLKRLAYDLATRGAAMALGLVVPFGLAALYFWRHGALGDAIAWGLLFNRSYLAEGPDLWTALVRFSLQFFGMVVPNAVIFGAGGFGLWSLLKRGGAAGIQANVTGVTNGRWMLTAWALESMFCVTLGRRFFGHYFLQPELPLAILAAGPVAALWQRRPRLVAYGVMLPVLVFFLVAALPEVTHRWVYMIDPDYVSVGRAAAEETSPSDSIWVWGNVPQIYYAAERMPGVRFTFCNYLTGLSPGTRSEYDPTVDPRKNAVTSAWKLVMDDLDARRPALVLDTAAADMKFYGKFPIASFPLLGAYLKAHYRPERAVAGVVFYRRLDSK